MGCISSEKRPGTNKPQNHLVNSLSPYLLEHADNPVDWHEWNDETLNTAKEQNKLLLISIGYAACHWCHVMEEESFMDTAVANLMNKNFVCIKVDREERPDIDQIYINAAQLLNGSAGWPLHAFALADGKPFYAATYFPKEEWKSLLSEIININKQQHDNVTRQADKLTEAIKAVEGTAVENRSTTISKGTLKSYFKNLSSAIDQTYGGLKGVPKFPLPVNLEFLLQYHYLTDDTTAMTAAINTLDKIARGGIYDHLGGGFARYATDRDWKIPHFEKMLYDNAQLISIFAHAYQVTKSSLYENRIRRSIEFVERELRSSHGGFYSSVNADSEKEEGKFYVWRLDHLRTLLTKPEFDFATNYYSLSDSGNWENGKNILFQRHSDLEFTRMHSIVPSVLKASVNTVNGKLLAERNKRVRPSTDTKLITSWNALMVIAYADAFAALGDEKYLHTAIETATFIDNRLVDETNGLFHSFNEGHPTITGFLDDYGLVARSYVSLYEVTFDIQWLAKARMLSDFAIEHFFDEKTGLFFYTSDQGEKLIARKMELTDNVIPSSNAIIAEVLFRLGEYYQNENYLQISKNMVQQISSSLTAQGPYYSRWASLAALMNYNPFEVAVMGKNSTAIRRDLQKEYNPLALYLGGEEENLPLLQNKLVADQTFIYVCRNKVCKLPVKTVAEAFKLLQSPN